MSIPNALLEQAKRTDLLPLAERYSLLRKVSSQEWAGPCPRCGGDDRFHVQSGWFFCRQCHPERGDAIAFLRWLYPGLSFAEAVERLTNTPVTTGDHNNRHNNPPNNQYNIEAQQWAHNVAVTLIDAQNRLLESEGEPGRDYLASRGLEPRTWLQFGLGYRADVSVPGTGGNHKAPAISLPWYAGGKLVAVRYRFLEAQQRRKVTSESGSRFGGRLFGAQGLPDWVRPTDSESRLERFCDLVIAEGESNSMSIWQVAGHSNLHVLSLGSESAKLSEAMIRFAMRYRHVILWADKPEVARALQTALPGANSLTSPQGMDANDLLRKGLLGAVLSVARLRACQDDHEREGLLWDLWDAERTWGGVDNGTIQAIRHIAGELGKSVAG